MRTDVKIGLLVGLFVIVAVIIWVASQNSSSTPPADANTTQGPSDTPGTNDNTVYTRSADDANTATTEDELSSIAVLPPATAPADEPNTSAGPSVGTDTPAASSYSDSYPITGITVTSVSTGGNSGSQEMEIYTVKKNDSLWKIAVAKYGDGRQYTLITDANPGVTTDTVLRPGQKLKIPPKPTAPSPVTTDATATTVETIAPDGTRIYTVTADDTRGYWGIAEKVYNNGKYYKLIAKANPDVDPTRLHAGQKLTIPPKPADTTTRTPTDNTPPTSGTDSGNTGSDTTFQRPVFD